jgi:hypothetical protein
MRVAYGFTLLALAVAAPAMGNAGPALPDELVLSGQNIIDVTINGQPLRLEVRPEAAEAPTLNADVAARLGLKPGMVAFRSMVGPEKVNGNSSVHRVDYGAGERKQRIFWTDRQSSTIADGTISPASLPYKKVTFRLGEADAGEREISLPLDNFGFLGRLGVGTTLELNGEKVRFQFSLARDETLVSAPTGNWLAQNRGGKFTGQPRQTLIFYGIQRPTREMTLSQSIALGPRELVSADVRYSDYGDASGIASADDTSGDSDEIVVVGDKKRDVDLRIVAGRAFLKGCASLTYDMQKRTLGLRCRS